ncbi:MAG: hypothetical protein QHH75_10420 [Bacillota bacterium]|nr:hypothetical protein [Bacillota bacterium]
MLFRNLALVIAAYAAFLGFARLLLPFPKLLVFACLALPGVAWASCDAADLSGVGKNRDVVVWSGIAAAAAVALLFLVF